MELTKDAIKQWLKKSGRSREWLGQQCGGVSLKAVNNWLSTDRPVPPASLEVIRRLMEDDERATAAKKSPDLERFTIECEAEEFDAFNAAANKRHLLVRKWALEVLKEAAKQDQSINVSSAMIPVRPLAPVVPEEPSHEKIVPLPYFGLVAAGQPGGPIDVPDGEFDIWGDYDPSTHYVLRVNGESMAPEYPDKTLILCRKLRDGEYAKKGDDVIACDASGCYFKRLEYRKDGPKGDSPRKARPRLVSLNPEYDEVIPVADCPIVAVVERNLLD